MPPQLTARATGPTRPSRRTAAERTAVASARRLAEEHRSRRHRLATATTVAVAALLVVAAVVALVRPSTGGTATDATVRYSATTQVVPTTPAGPVTVQEPAREVVDGSGVPGVLAWDTGDGAEPAASPTAGPLTHDHVPGPVTYSITPPVGGPHHAVWMNAGTYTSPVPNERAVHDMAHGAVWITYRPDLPAPQVRALRSFVHRQSLVDESSALQLAGQASRYVVLSPWADDSLPSPVVISAWGHQLRVDDAGDPRLQRFVDTFRASPRYTPEYGEPVDGEPVAVAGRPAADGASWPNPTSGR